MNDFERYLLSNEYSEIYLKGISEHGPEMKAPVVYDMGLRRIIIPCHLQMFGIMR